tara:strand:+ start:526 stop:1395 length:870 start_codon:yes stop_codon:yes gene_type:complete
MCNNCKIIEDTRLELRREHGSIFWTVPFKDWKGANPSIVDASIACKADKDAKEQARKDKLAEKHKNEYINNDLFFIWDEYCETPQKIAFWNDGKPYGYNNCYRCDGTGIYQWATEWGHSGGTCYKCMGSGKDSGRLYLKKEMKWQKSAKLRLDATKQHNYDILIEANALKRIAYNHSEKAVAQRAKRLAWKKEKIQTKNNSEFVGQLKDRGTFDLTLTFRKGFDTDFGVSFLNTLKDAQGNVFTYWGNSFLDVEVDTTITVKATIKDHKEYDGTKQTVINRPKIIEGVS